MKKIKKKTDKIFFIKFFLYIKIVNKYYQKNKEKLWKEACQRYQNLSGEEKDKKRKKVWDRYQNLLKEQKQKLLVYMKKYYLAHKQQFLSWFMDF